ncbi:MAG: ABC transporter substrate-binding protein [Sphingomonadales bacterium]
MRLFLLGWLAVSLFNLGATARADDATWQQTLATARGQTVYFYAWAGDQKINAYIRWAGDEVAQRFGIRLHHVKTADTGNLIATLLAEKAAGRNQGGRADLVWINGEHFHAMREAGLLHGPFAQALPNFRLVDIVGKPATITDFALPTDGYESPWGYAQLTFFHDAARLPSPPRSIAAILDWAKNNPGRFSYPAPPDFIGTTFLKQVLIAHVTDRQILKSAPDDATFNTTTAPLWSYLDALHPHLWRQGRTFPPNSPALRQLLGDGEIDLAFAFNPAEAASSINQGLLPASVRAYILDGGTLANAHFLAIPFNANAPAAAKVVANFMLSPMAQAHKADPRIWGDPSVLALDRLTAEERAAFDALPRPITYPSVQELAHSHDEPHPDWTVRLERAWISRYGR